MKSIENLLKKNFITVWVVIILSFTTVIGALIFSYKIWKSKPLYAITETGNVVPLHLIQEKEDNFKRVLHACNYFVKQFYELNQYTVEDKKEKVLWLANDKFKNFFKDKVAKGYYNRFIQFSIIQNAKIVPNSIVKLSDVEPYKIKYKVELEVINANSKDYYIVENELELMETDIHYPYNPFGLLITNFIESNLLKINK